MLQILFVVGEALVARPLIGHITCETHVPKANILPFEVMLQHRFDPGAVLHPVGEAVAEDGHRVVLLEGKWLGSFHQGGG